jgi:hypothetical protein
MKLTHLLMRQQSLKTAPNTPFWTGRITRIEQKLKKMSLGSVCNVRLPRKSLKKFTKRSQ